MPGQKPIPKEGHLSIYIGFVVYPIAAHYTDVMRFGEDSHGWTSAARKKYNDILRYKKPIYIGKCPRLNSKLQ